MFLEVILNEYFVHILELTAKNGSVLKFLKTLPQLSNIGGGTPHRGVFWKILCQNGVPGHFEILKFEQCSVIKNILEVGKTHFLG